MKSSRAILVKEKVNKGYPNTIVNDIGSISKNLSSHNLNSIRKSSPKINKRKIHHTRFHSDIEKINSNMKSSFKPVVKKVMIVTKSKAFPKQNFGTHQMGIVSKFKNPGMSREVQTDRTPNRNFN